ncbi:MAG TPA: ABC-2 family transporter protein [Candidatus Methylacidiphilales bacterium]|nr:ABC-2 family transporter protein [Candidatus Methylacidiphilales bacterium]
MLSAPLRLHAQIFNLGVQSNLIYRWNFLLRVAVSFVPLLGSVFLWNAVFSGNRGFAGYTFSSMVAYFITLILLDALTVPNEDDFQIAEDIREGQINALLLKPLEYRLYRFHLFASARIVHAVFALPVLALAMIWLGHYFAGLPWLANLPLALLATAGAALIQFYLCFSLAMIAFWILDIGSVTFIIYSVEFLLSGHIFPVDAFPLWLRTICYHLPFVYETFFPAAILIGHVGGTALWEGFLAQWAWIGFLYVLSGVMWKRGLREYTAVGG